jgi:cytochrome c-type biogenesis protein
MLSFAAGIILPFVAVAIGGDLSQGQLNKIKRYLPKIEEFTGYALIAVSVMIFIQANPSSLLMGKQKNESEIAFVNAAGPTTLDQLAPGANRLLFFHTSHCPICQQMETFIPVLEKECNSKDFKIVRINVELPENTAIANKFNINAVPTMILITPDGRELAHTVGYQSETNLRRAINLFPSVSCAELEPMHPRENNPASFPEGKSCNQKDSGISC